MKRNKQPTLTCLSLQVLKGRDDFMTTRQIADELRTTTNRVQVTLMWLRSKKVVDCVIDPDGVAWWLDTSEHDARNHHVDERCPECEPRKRKKRVKPTGGN